MYRFQSALVAELLHVIAGRSSLIVTVTPRRVQPIWRAAMPPIIRMGTDIILGYMATQLSRANAAIARYSD
jgi:hypothetical protein